MNNKMKISSKKKNNNFYRNNIKSRIERAVQKGRNDKTCKSNRNKKEDRKPQKSITN